jgi:hypothetical protein
VDFEENLVSIFRESFSIMICQVSQIIVGHTYEAMTQEIKITLHRGLYIFQLLKGRQA